MKRTGLDVFDTSIQRTSLWLNDLMRELNWNDRRRAFLALRCVLHSIRDHLTVEQTVHLGNQLPLLIRGFYFENWEPADKPLPWRARQELLSNICQYLVQNGNETADAEKIVRAVFRLLNRKTVEGEIEDLHRLLPLDLQELWPDRLRAA